MAEWITHAQVRKRLQEENGTALSLCNTTYRTNLHYAFLYTIQDKVYDNGKWYIAYITNDQRINVPISATLIKEMYGCLEEKLKE